MEKNPLISFIIVNYRGVRLLPDCLAAIETFSDVAKEIIIVNNDPQPLSEEPWLKNASIINSPTNLGFGQGANLGAQNAQGEFFCFLNPDAALVSGQATAIIQTFNANPQLAIIGPAILNSTGQPEPWSAGLKINFLELIRSNLGLSRSRREWKKSAPSFPDWVSGAVLFIRRETFRQLAGFDPNFFLYFEDVDLCQRVRASGKKILRLPAIKVRHLSGKSFADPNEQKRFYYAAQEYYFRKHFGGKTAWMVKLIRRLTHPNFNLC